MRVIELTGCESTPLSKCIEFKGCKDSHGYGILSVNNKPYKAHRLSYRLYVGPLVNGLVIDHICRNKICINPDHLRQVTIRQNVLENSIGEAAKNIVKKLCSKGHPLIEGNLQPYGLKKGHRNCLVCWKEKDLRYKMNNREKIREYNRKRYKLKRSSDTIK